MTGGLGGFGARVQIRGIVGVNPGNRPVGPVGLALGHGIVASLLAGTIRQVEASLVLPRAILDARRARQADGLVELERGPDIVGAFQQAAGDRNRVLDSLGAALAHERDHWMAGVAQHRYPAIGPALDRWAVKHGPDEGLIDLVD